MCGLHSHKEAQKRKKLASDSPGSAPAILVVPTDHDVARVDVAPPRLKFLTRNVERCRGDEMIENYRVLLAPAKL